jgi:hypothetical protein
LMFRKITEYWDRNLWSPKFWSHISNTLCWRHLGWCGNTWYLPRVIIFHSFQIPFMLN